jgi:hypothetical protein
VTERAGVGLAAEARQAHRPEAGLELSVGSEVKGLT